MASKGLDPNRAPSGKGVTSDKPVEDDPNTQKALNNVIIYYNLTIDAVFWLICKIF